MLHRLYLPYYYILSYSILSHIIRVTNSRWAKWARHVESVVEGGNVYSFWWGKLKGKIPFERPRHISRDITISLSGNVWECGPVCFTHNGDKWWALMNIVMGL
jgi:hypothetical protein